MTWTRGRFLVFDLEATGLNIAEDRIVQLAYDLIDDDEVVERGVFYVDPEIPIPEDSVNIHGLTAQRLAQLNAKPFRFHAPAVQKLLVSVDGVVAYNALRYDVPLLRTEMSRAGVDCPINLIVDPFVILFVHETSKGMRIKRKLTAAADRLGVGLQPDERAHDARSDVRMCRDIWLTLRKDPSLSLPTNAENFQFLQAQWAAWSSRTFGGYRRDSK